MRLINIYTLQLQSFGDNPPPYATLSHRWAAEESTYEDFIDLSRRQGAGFRKIQKFCQTLRQKKLYANGARKRVRWCWVDTCCIDKRSSAELSEAINSMARIYQQCVFCIAHLYDVDVDDESDSQNIEDRVSKSEWFTRGWTLQELLFPPHLVFYDLNWSYIPGFDSSLQDTRLTLTWITGIPSKCIGGGDLIYGFSVASRMSWACGRLTTRVEDRAYSLLGLFKINMPLLYGEGANAFYRLQEQIIERYDDETIFCWTEDSNGDPCPLLAPSPDNFNDYRPIRVALFERRPYRTTNQGLEIETKAIRVQWTRQSTDDIEPWIDEFIIIPLNSYQRYTEQHEEAHSWYLALEEVLPRRWARIYANTAEDKLWSKLAKKETVTISMMPMAIYHVFTTPGMLDNYVAHSRDDPELANLVRFDKLAKDIPVVSNDKTNSSPKAAFFPELCHKSQTKSST